MKINIMNHSKKFLCGFCALLLVAVVILCVFGFNLGADIKGYVQLEVNSNSVYYANEKEFTKEIVSFLEDNDAKVIATNKEGSGFTANLVIKIDKKSKDRQENINYAKSLEELVENHYSDDMLVVSSSLVEGYMTDTTVIRLTYTILISVIIIMIYLIFRVKLINTLCILATTLGTGLIMASLMVITRVPLNSNIYGVFASFMLFSTILSTILISDVRKHTKDELHKEEIGVINLVSPKMLTYYALIVSFLVFVIFGSSMVRSYAILVILGIISVCLTDNIMLMPLCYYLNQFETPKKEEQTEVADEETTEEIEEDVAVDNAD